MIARILTVLFFFILICAIAFWLISGGWATITRTASILVNPASIVGNGTSTGLFQLPWQPTSLTRGPDISQLAIQADAQIAGDSSAQDQTNVPAQSQTFGNPSPYAGEITISEGGATASGIAAQYVELDASGNNSGPVDISGWSLQSVVTGAREPLPEAAPIFIAGIVNTVDPVELAPGDSAIVASGVTPVGTSFRENICSGYLEQLQTFTPELPNNCPTPASALPETSENLRVYGSACFDYLGNLPSCYFPGNSLPASLSSACASFVENTMSYNGCVNEYRNSVSFASPVWRLYLNMNARLWNSDHDIIRLLDSEGRTVDVLTY
jgi:hypothetical protein